MFYRITNSTASVFVQTQNRERQCSPAPKRLNVVLAQCTSDFIWPKNVIDSLLAHCHTGTCMHCIVFVLPLLGCRLCVRFLSSFLNLNSTNHTGCANFSSCVCSIPPISFEYRSFTIVILCPFAFGIRTHTHTLHTSERVWANELRKYNSSKWINK